MANILQFGAFEISIQSRELRKRGLRVKISPQAFSALVCLIEQCGQLVSRDDLCSRLWPDRVHVEFDGSLNAVIRDVREVLGDSAKNPRYIETEPKLGYRFIAPVRSLRGSEPQVPDPDEPVDRQEGEGEVWSTALPMHPAPALAQPDSSASLRARRRLAFLLAFPASVCALAAGWWGLSRSGEPLRAPTISQYSYYVGKVGHPTFSPDGARIAFHWNADDKGGFDIYRKGYYSDDLVRLTHDPADDVYPAWSPDGREIAFGRRLANGRMAVLVVPAAGGPERRVAELPHEGPFAWAADGQAIAYSVAFPLGMPGVGEKGGIWIVQLATGER
ncbi:MAG TPA: winged helix-turn-helix domain-containing protein, partial [Candidatus Acidoferrum sp.]